MLQIAVIARTNNVQMATSIFEHDWAIHFNRQTPFELHHLNYTIWATPIMLLHGLQRWSVIVCDSWTTESVRPPQLVYMLLVHRLWHSRSSSLSVLYNVLVIHWEYPYLSNILLCMRISQSWLKACGKWCLIWVYVSICICEKDKESVAFCSLVCSAFLSLLDWSDFLCACIYSCACVYNLLHVQVSLSEFV